MFAKGQMGNMLKQAQQMQQKMQEMQENLAEVSAQGEAAAGMVKMTVNGHKELVGVEISQEAVEDREMLEDLIIAAYNSALALVNEKVQEKTAEMTKGMGLPPGVKLPF